MITRQKFEEFYQHWIDKGYDLNVAKEEPFDPKAGGVPPDMWASDVDEDGWVKWKLLESTLSEADIDELQADYQVSLPP